jgi:hypothetical protein
VSIYLAWTDAQFAEDLPGPWTATHGAAPGVLLVDSQQSLSRVYHELKWSMPAGAALLVSPVAGRPKLTGLAPGTLSWLRARITAPAP